MDGAERRFLFPFFGFKGTPSYIGWQEAWRLCFLAFLCCVCASSLSPSYIPFFPCLLLRSSACLSASASFSPCFAPSSLPYSLSPALYLACPSHLTASPRPFFHCLAPCSVFSHNCPPLILCGQPCRKDLSAFAGVPNERGFLHGPLFPTQPRRIGLATLFSAAAGSRNTTCMESYSTESRELTFRTKLRRFASTGAFANCPRFLQLSGFPEKLRLPMTHRCTYRSARVQKLWLRSTRCYNFAFPPSRHFSFVPLFSVGTQRWPCENFFSFLPRCSVTEPSTSLNSSLRDSDCAAPLFPLADASSSCLPSTHPFYLLHSFSHQGDHHASHSKTSLFRGGERRSPFYRDLFLIRSRDQQENICGLTRRGGEANIPGLTRATEATLFEATPESQCHAGSAAVKIQTNNIPQQDECEDKGQEKVEDKEDGEPEEDEDAEKHSPERKTAPDGGDGEDECWQRYPEVKNRVQDFLRKLRYDAALATIIANYGAGSSPGASSAVSLLPSSPSRSSLSSSDIFSLSDGFLQSCPSVSDRRRQAAAQLFNRVLQNCAFYATLPLVAKTFCLYLPSPLVEDVVQELRETRQEKRGVGQGKEMAESEPDDSATYAVEGGRIFGPKYATGVSVLRNAEGGTKVPGQGREVDRKEERNSGGHSLQRDYQQKGVNTAKKFCSGRKYGALEGTREADGIGSDSRAPRSEMYGHADSRQYNASDKVPTNARKPLFLVLVEAFDRFTQILDSDRWLLSPEYDKLLSFWRRGKDGNMELHRGSEGAAEEDQTTMHESDTREHPNPHLSSLRKRSSKSLRVSEQSKRVESNRLNEKFEGELPPLDLSADRANRRELTTCLLKYLMENPSPFDTAPPPSSPSRLEETQIMEDTKTKGDISCSSPSSSLRRASGEEQREEDLLSFFPFLEDAAEARAGQLGRELKKRRLRRCCELLEEAARPCNLKREAIETRNTRREERVESEESICGDRVRKPGEEGREVRHKRCEETEKGREMNDAFSGSSEEECVEELKQRKIISSPLSTLHMFANDSETPKGTRRREALEVQLGISSSGLNFSGDSRTHVTLLGAALAAGHAEEARRQLQLIDKKTIFLDFPAHSEETGEIGEASRWIQVFQPSFLRRLQAAGFIPLKHPVSCSGTERPGIYESTKRPTRLKDKSDGDEGRPLAREVSEGWNVKRKQEHNGHLKVLFAAFLEAAHQAERCPRNKHRHGAALFRVKKPGEYTGALGSSSFSTSSPLSPLMSPSSSLASSSAVLHSSEYPFFRFFSALRGSEVLSGGRNFVLHREKKKSEGKKTLRRRAGASGGEHAQEAGNGDIALRDAELDPLRSGQKEEWETTRQRNSTVEIGDVERGETKGKGQTKTINSLVVHAEVDCLSQVPPDAAHGAAVCIVELDATGLGYEASHPCPMCLQALQKRRISRAFFTTPLGLRALSIRINDRVAVRPTPAPLAFVEEVLAARKNAKREENMAYRNLQSRS
ncbi:hypothetical protein TGRUB_315420 [Toxoplasma gondii RUB]|uniref:Uncharacterized protein n=1 Tax=Toxoplasma gondii RUB TaxID=935652 RepID=A0A086MBP5_TOXGO|nr:hypothetical protein TGRUB_315420 [Toxoplasma gondii RUB]